MDDLISRRAAIEAIKTWGLLIDGLSEGQATEILSNKESLPSAQPEQKWIPCSERLPEIDETREVAQALNEFADKLKEIQNKYKNNDEISYTPEEVGEILRTEGQEHGRKYGFKLGDTIKFTPSEVEKILKTKICTYRETGCGSCEHPQSCPYKAERMKIVLDKGAYMPVRGHATDAGLDIRTPEAFTLKAHGQQVIKTGLHVQIPEGYFGKLESKSGLNVNYSVVSLGGVIDCGFTGQIIAKLYSMSDEDYHFNAGDKFIQMIIQPCLTPELEVVDSLEETERGNSGFGSTGR